jgi:hypothetical protein
LSGDQLSTYDFSGGKKMKFCDLLRQSSIKLLIALVGIFLFFVFALGLQQVFKTRQANNEILTKLKAQGVPAQKRLEDSRL